ncbi:hypothetical protein AB8Z38_29985 [Bradyrhizobium sp. LLZ17]|uniref:Uncharacterized protein n=1 Tax=Bradyrhizobium sp. LLZ17 TaxID=3239388 RepID=A0AB39XFX0_9BRAD|nr:hypothetical protein [Bradyrhizobium sp. WSM1417]
MDYRAYSQDGHISGVQELDCADDDEAKAKATQMLDRHDLELWQRDRRVAVLKRHTRQ